MKIGDEVYIHGYVDEIRQNVVIIRNEGGYFGTVPEEIRSSSEIPNTCGDAISRQEVLNAITMAEVRWQAVDNVNKLPSVTPQQRTGRWILTDDDFVYCSECEDSYYPRPIDASWYYCPHCGAKMEAEE